MSVGWSRGSNLMKVSRNFGCEWISLDSVDITQLFISRELPSAIELVFFPEIIRRFPSEGYLWPSPGIGVHAAFRNSS